MGLLEVSCLALVHVEHPAKCDTGIAFPRGMHAEESSVVFEVELTPLPMGMHAEESSMVFEEWFTFPRGIQADESSAFFVFGLTGGVMPDMLVIGAPQKRAEGRGEVGAEIDSPATLGCGEEPEQTTEPWLPPGDPEPPLGTLLRGRRSSTCFRRGAKRCPRARAPDEERRKASLSEVDEIDEALL